MMNITLEQIIHRKIRYYQNETDDELRDMNAGYVRGFEQMLSDMDLSETAFVDKYTSIIKELALTFTSFEGEKTDTCIDELSGYNNAIVEVLSLLDQKYLYDEEI